MGYNYKCERCGVTIYVDPGEPRMCDDCLEKDAQYEQKITNSDSPENTTVGKII